VTHHGLGSNLSLTDKKVNFDAGAQLFPGIRLDEDPAQAKVTNAGQIACPSGTPESINALIGSARGADLR